MSETKNIHFTEQDFPKMEKRYRTHLMNSLSGFKSANLVGTTDENGNHNLAMISSVIHLGSNPALMGFISRPSTVRRDTFSNIVNTGTYTINHVSVDMYAAAHQTSARYAPGISEFKEVGLTPFFTTRLKAPYVQESHIKIGLELKQVIKIELNGTMLIIGEIVELLLPTFALQEDGFLDIEKAKTVAVTGLDSYHRTEKIKRLPYAKVKHTNPPA